MSTSSISQGEGAALGLVGDIGGTNARFALVDVGTAAPQLYAPRALRCDRFATADAAIEAYLEMCGRSRPRAAVIAVAGPVEAGAAKLTNAAWSLSEKSLRDSGFATARLINDFEALALGVAMLPPEHVRPIGPELPRQAGQTMAVIGAGTGFGVAAVTWHEGRPFAVPSEGGHAGFAPADGIEAELLKILQERFGRVSIERILSGPGLQNLYSALAEYYGAPAVAPEPEVISRQALWEDDHCSLETLDRFCAIFGTVAGDLALSFGARGGVYLAGGVAPFIIERLEQSHFRRRFEAKGRFAAYMRTIPTGLVTHPHTALLGAAEQLRRMRAKRARPSLVVG